mgnify:CR=1 FL=1
MKKNIVLFIIVAFLFSCTKNLLVEPSYEEGLNPELYEAFNQAKEINNIRSLSIYQNGNLIRQAFYNDCNPYLPQDVRSVTKSIISLLIGIAIDKGFIKSIDQTLSEFEIPVIDSLPIKISHLKLHHLLSMTAGFEWEELQNVYNYNWWIKAPSQIQYIITKPIVNEPGSIFSYNSASYHLLSIVLTNASKMNTLEFATKYLFEPLDIGIRNWEKDKEGFYNGSSGLCLSPYDMYKIGQLVLNHGEYNGKKIVSPKWIDEITSGNIQTGTSHPYANEYGLGWWIGYKNNKKYIFANGYGGQYIVIVPENNLIITATNHWYGVKYSLTQDQWIRTMKIIVEEIIPYF